MVEPQRGVAGEEERGEWRPGFGGRSDRELDGCGEEGRACLLVV